MADVARTRFVSVLILAVIFVSGILVGMAVDREMEAAEAPAGTSSMAAPGSTDEASGERRGDDRRERRRPIYEQVGLNEAQEVRIDSIVRHFREEVETARKEARREWDSRWWEMVLETREAIKSVLDPDQAMRYDSLLEAAFDNDDDGEGGRGN